MAEGQVFRRDGLGEREGTDHALSEWTGMIFVWAIRTQMVRDCCLHAQSQHDANKRKDSQRSELVEDVFVHG